MENFISPDDKQFVQTAFEKAKRIAFYLNPEGGLKELTLLFDKMAEKDAVSACETLAKKFKEDELEMQGSMNLVTGETSISMYSNSKTRDIIFSLPPLLSVDDHEIFNVPVSKSDSFILSIVSDGYPLIKRKSIIVGHFERTS